MCRRESHALWRGEGRRVKVGGHWGKESKTKSSWGQACLFLGDRVTGSKSGFESLPIFLPKHPPLPVSEP